MANSWSRIKFTKEGGLAVWLLNKTRSASVKGEVLESSAGTDDAVDQAVANALHPMGITYVAGIAVGTYMWVVVSGRVEVLADAGGFTRDDRLVTSATAGRADVSNLPTPAVHFQEIGHGIGTAAGNGLGFAIVHFN